MARCACRTDSRVHRMRLVNSLGRMSFLPAPLPSPRNCADNGTNVAAKARVKSCAPCLSTRLMILASKKLSVFGDVMNRAFQSLRKAFPRLKKIFNRTNCPYPNSRALPERVLQDVLSARSRLFDRRGRRGTRMGWSRALRPMRRQYADKGPAFLIGVGRHKLSRPCRAS